jgi:hypothetical protein
MSAQRRFGTQRYPEELQNVSPRTAAQLSQPILGYTKISDADRMKRLKTLETVKAESVVSAFTKKYPSFTTATHGLLTLLATGLDVASVVVPGTGLGATAVNSAIYGLEIAQNISAISPNKDTPNRNIVAIINDMLQLSFTLKDRVRSTDFEINTLVQSVVADIDSLVLLGSLYSDPKNYKASASNTNRMDLENNILQAAAIINSKMSHLTLLLQTTFMQVRSPRRGGSTRKEVKKNGSGGGHWRKRNKTRR